jgi:hypothetical protein
MSVLDRLLLRCGLFAGPLFIGGVLIQGATREDYSPLRHPVSTLSLGPRGGVQVANFAVTGCLSMGFAVGLSRTLCAQIGTRAGPVLLGVAAAGILGAGAFRTDPVGGYPPATPNVPTDITAQGALHDMLTVPAFLCVPAAQLAFARAFFEHRDRRWATYSAVSAFGMLLAYALATAGFHQTRDLDQIAGALQRAAITIGFAWVTGLAARALAAAK